MPGRALMIGFDGATWDLLDTLMERGLMPRLSDLKKKGTSAYLRSTDPPVTGPAWVSMVTGVNPGVHGVFDFTLPTGNLFERAPASTSDIAVKTIYEKAGPAILLNLPVTYPALTEYPTVTSLMTGSAGPLHPEHMRKRPWSSSYRVVPDASLLRSGKLARYAEDIRDLEKVRFEALKDLWKTEGWRLLLSVFSGSDWISHAAYRTLLEDPGELREGEALFNDLDGYLGWMIDNLGAEDHLLLISDHGFGVKKGFFLINEWLAREGLAVLKPAGERKAVHAMDSALHENDAPSGNPPPGNAIERFKAPGLKGRFWRRVYKNRVETWSPHLTPDPSSTLAVAPSAEQNGIYINDSERFSGGRVSPGDRAELTMKIIRELEAVEDPEGKRLFEWVRPAAEIYDGSRQASGPDIIFSMADWECSAATSLYHLDIFEERSVGGHKPYGIALGYGRDIEAATLESMDIVDVAPVLLHWLGEPVPGQMEGKVPDLLSLHREVAHCKPWGPPERQRPSGEEEMVAERLRGLGYLG